MASADIESQVYQTCFNHCATKDCWCIAALPSRFFYKSAVMSSAIAWCLPESFPLRVFAEEFRYDDANIILFATKQREDPQLQGRISQHLFALFRYLHHVHSKLFILPNAFKALKHIHRSEGFLQHFPFLDYEECARVQNWIKLTNAALSARHTVTTNFNPTSNCWVSASPPKYPGNQTVLHISTTL